jgi:hypothetical protein
MINKIKLYNILKFCVFLKLLLVYNNCKKIEEKEFVNCNTTIINDSIYKININRGTLTLNNNYNFFGSYPLIFNEKFPTWIKDYDSPDYSFNKYIFEPDIYDIKPPYIIYKQQDSCFFYIIKNNDTLKFKITNVP